MLIQTFLLLLFWTFFRVLPCFCCFFLCEFSSAAEVGTYLIVLVAEQIKLMACRRLLLIKEGKVFEKKKVLEKIEFFFALKFVAILLTFLLKINFLVILFKFGTNFPQIYPPFCSNFAAIFVQILSPFCSSFVAILFKFCRHFVQVWFKFCRHF